MASQQVHPTAIVHANAQIGKDVEIGPYAIIEEHVVIGDRCRIDAHAVIKDYTRMGVGNHIHSHALVGGEPQDLKFQGEVTWLELGDDNRIREFATLHRGTEGGGGITRIGSRNLCMAYTHIAHDCQLGNDIVMSNGATLGGHVRVDDFAIIGGLSAVHQFGHVGTHAFVGGMTGVAQDLPRGCWQRAAVRLCMAPILWDCAAPGLPARRSPLSNRPSASFGAVRCPAPKPWICLRTTTQICLK